MYLSLPAYVFEHNIQRLFRELDSASGCVECIELDFSKVKHWIPAGIAAILVRFYQWKQEDRPFRFLHLDKCEALSYLQRIDFFKVLGVEIEEQFARHEAKTFVPLHLLESSDDINDIAPKVARNITKALTCDGKVSDDIEHTLTYSISEIALNVLQHSQGVGVISAQYNARRDYFRIGIADNGIGILKSFQEKKSPFYNSGMDDIAGIELALQPEKGSTLHLKPPYGDNPNAGVGLSMVSTLAKLTYGHFFLGSGRAFYYRDGNQKPQVKRSVCWNGTVVSIAFQREEIYNKFDLMHQARIDLGLVSAPESATSEDTDLFQ